MAIQQKVIIQYMFSQQDLFNRLTELIDTGVRIISVIRTTEFIDSNMNRNYQANYLIIIEVGKADD